MNVLARGLGAPLGLAHADGALYWANFNGASVMKLKLSEGSVSTVASGLAHPMHVVVDQTAVYFTDFGNGAVFRAER